MKQVVVSRLHLKILEAFEQGNNIQKVASICKTTEYQILYIVKEMLKAGYLVKSGRNLIPADFDFHIGSRSDFLKDRVTYKKHIATVQAIQRYVPSPEIGLKVMGLVSLGFKRSEIARQLNMSKSEVLWTIFENTKPNSGENRPETIIYVSNLEYKIYNKLNLFDDINKVAKALKITKDQLHNYLGQLEEVGAIMINRNNKNKFTYLQCDVLLKVQKEIKDDYKVQKAE